MAAQKLRTPWVTLRLPGGRFSYRLDRRALSVLPLLAAFTLAALVFSISYGEYSISPAEVVQTLTGRLDLEHPEYRPFNLVVHTFRLPRILVAWLAGAALAVSGALMQGVTRNPLADPYLLGVSGGAGLAAVTIIVWLDGVSLSALPFAAFGGALLAAGLVYALAWKDGGSAPMRLILIGVAVASVTGALTTLLLVFGEINDVQAAYVWLTGSVYGRGWDHVRALGGWLLVFLPLALLCARALNALGLGDEAARGLGMHVERARALALLISVGLAAGAVAAAGTIGFVGLVAPHIARRLVGPSHEGLLPASALLGGALLVSADLIGRWVIAPSELPIGVVTAMLGAPYFMFLLARARGA
jgi:iron complex transport system permease protein